MANLTLSELPLITQIRANDLIYDVQEGVSSQLGLSSLFHNIPVDISLQSGFSLLSAGSELTTLYDGRYYPYNDARVREEQGSTTFPGGAVLSSFGNTTVALSGAHGAINIFIPLEGQGCPLENFEITFIQSGQARLELVAQDPATTFFGTGSGLKGPNTTESLQHGSLSSHKTSGIFSSLKLTKLPSTQGTNRWIALTANG